MNGCTCGWGGVHDADNPRCDLYETAPGPREDVAVALTEEERAEILRAGFSTHDHLLQRDTTLAAVERIIAERERRAAVEAWDEGYSDGLDYMSLPGSVRQVEPENPYRADRRAEW